MGSVPEVVEKDTTRDRNRPCQSWDYRWKSQDGVDRRELKGLLPEMCQEAGFSQVEKSARNMAILGMLSFHAEKPS